MPDPSPRRAAWHLTRQAAAVAVVRLRFLALVGGLLGLLAAWPFLQNAFDKWTTAAPTGGTISRDTEYWCPMCPGVVSEWPAKCPVCNMALVRRQKGEMTPLPDGVVARVQLSPYRIQLAGLRTVPVEFRRLECEVVLGGLLESRPGAPSSLALAADVFEPDASALSPGQPCTVRVDGFPDETATGRIADIVAVAAGRRVRVLVENPRGEFRPGLYAAATFRTPVAALESSRRGELARWEAQTAAGLLAGPDVAFAALAEASVRRAAAAGGLTLCVPEAAVIDTGTRRVVYMEAMPGVFDAVEVRLGRRCGDFYPVRGGLELGQRVAAAGAILLDAETRLNPSVAASYFGAGVRAAPAALPPSDDDDAPRIAQQKLCPVTGEPLGSMGKPVRVTVAGRAVFVCCKACEKPLLRAPDEYLAKLPK